MKLFVVLFVCGLASAAKLPNSYLPPPSNSISAGGSGSFLRPPGGNQFGGSSPQSQQYLPPQQQGFNNFGSPNAYRHGTRPQQQFGQQQQPFGQQQSFGQQQQRPSFGQSGAGSYAGAGSNAYNRPSGQQIPILKYENVNNGDGNYHFDYETGNGIKHNEQGTLLNAGGANPEQAVTGSYSYPGEDGKTYTVHYKADANGFQPIGDHLPTPPPIPEAIQKSIQTNAAAGNYYSGQGQGSGQYSGGQSGFGGSSGFGGGSSSGFGGGSYNSGSSGFGGSPQKSYLPPSQPQRPSYNANTGYQY